MHLLDLPPELVNLITEFVAKGQSIDRRQGNLSSLAATCRQFYQHANPILYRENRLHSRSSALVWAAEHGVPEIFDHACRSGTDLRDCYTVPVLKAAAKMGNVMMIRELLQRCEIRYFETREAVDEALITDNAEIIQALIDGGLRLSKPIDGKLGTTYLHEAADKRANKCARVLLAAGADVSARDNDDLTPLYFAAAAENDDMVKLFMQHGATTGSLGDGIGSPLSKALNSYALNAAKAILRCTEPRVDAANQSAILPDVFFCNICGERDTEVLGLLLRHGANPNNMLHESPDWPESSSDPWGSSEAPSYSLYLTYSSDFTYSQDRNPPLCEATDRGNTEAVRLLLKHGANVNIRDAAGNTPLHLSLRKKGRTEIFFALIEAGADVNMSNARGSQPLHLVPQSRLSAKVIHALLARGADISTRNKEGLSALDRAAKDERFRVVSLLLDRCRSDMVLDYRTLLMAASHGNSKIVKRFLKLGANIEAADREGNTALLIAAAAGNSAVISLLLSKGANPTATNMHGKGALSIAAYCGNEDAVEGLLKSGLVNVDQQDPDQRTALSLAVMKNEANIVKMLLSHDPRPTLDVADRYATTPLIMAARNGNHSCLEHLLDALDSGESLTREDFWGHSVVSWASRTLDDEGRSLLERYAKKLGVDVAFGGDLPGYGSRWSENPPCCCCEICGRRTIHVVEKAGRAQCDSCRTGAIEYLICSFCAASGAKCRDPSHQWSSYSECIDPPWWSFEDSDESSEYTEEEGDSEDVD